MARAVAGAICLAVLATPAFAAGDAFEGASWIGVIFTGGMIAFFSFLAFGFGFFLGSLLKLSMALFVVLLVSLVLPIYVYLTLDLGRTIAVATAEVLMLLFFSPLMVWGWWLGRKDAARRSRPNTALNVGSPHG